MSGKPTSRDIKINGAIPWASQIVDDSETPRGTVAESLTEVNAAVGGRKNALIEDLELDSTDEQSVVLDGLATEQFAPLWAIVNMKDVGAGAIATGDVDISIGIASAGTEILAATEVTGLIAINTKKVIDLSAVVFPAIPANSEIFVKVTTKDTTAGAGHLADIAIIGEVIAGY